MSLRPTLWGANLQRVLDIGSDADIPGLTAAILYEDMAPWSGAVGVADPGGDRPMTAATQFGIGSMTKSFAAALLLRLVERGDLALQDPIARYLPPGTSRNGATVEEVLAHRSGIPEHVTPRFVADLLREPSRAWAPAEVLCYQEGRPVARGEFAYSSTNYILLGIAIEQITGTSVGTAMRDLLLTPLQLDRITYQADGAAETAGDRPDPPRWSDRTRAPRCQRAAALPVGGDGCRGRRWHGGRCGEPRTLGVPPVPRRGARAGGPAGSDEQ